MTNTCVSKVDIIEALKEALPCIIRFVDGLNVPIFATVEEALVVPLKKKLLKYSSFN